MPLAVTKKTSATSTKGTRITFITCREKKKKPDLAKKFESNNKFYVVM